MDINVSVDEASQIVANRIETKLESKEWLPNTARTYVNSLKLFLKYLLMMSLGNHYDYSSDKLRLFEASLGSWLKSLVKKDKQRPRDSSEIINPDDIMAYMTSSRAHSATKLCKTSGAKSHTNHTSVRNFLMMRVALANCHRTGCIINMQLVDFNQASQRNEHYVISVTDHKTSNTYGPAEVVMDKELYGDMKRYITHYRVATDVPFLFVTWNGTQLDSGAVAGALTTELGHAGVEKRFS